MIGAGFISHVHAEALRALPNCRITAVVDPVDGARARFAQRWGIENVFATVEELIRSHQFDCAHVVVPPAMHQDVGLQLLKAGKPVFIEKPLTPTVTGCDALIAASECGAVLLGVNQNLIYHPAFRRLLTAVRSARLGPARSVSCVYRVPLRQLAAAQFGHWMFGAPVNMLLEQMVHPLSQLARLAGTIGDVRALAARPIDIGPDRPLYSTVDVLLSCGGLPCQLHFAIGQPFPVWRITVACDDGLLMADMIGNQLLSQSRTRWMEPFDLAVSGTWTAAQLLGQSWRNAVRYVRSAAGYGSRSDPFFLGMSDSIEAFHRALDDGAEAEADGRFARSLVDACHRIAEQAMVTTPQRLPALLLRRNRSEKQDVAVIGGTGFVGAHVVRRFLKAGLRVSVMARKTQSLPAPFDDPRVTLHQGDVTDAAAVAQAVSGASVVVNLAHGGGQTPEEVTTLMMGGAETVARACLSLKVPLLIHIGSTASLYLGPRSDTVTGATPPDPLYASRGEYAQAKARTDRLLLEMADRDGLPLCILRPSIIVGAGAPALHGGFGFYNNEQHCIGWNRGRNRLPLVLVEDVAEAVYLASQADVAGRCYNLVGDVRPTAREFIAMLARSQQRPLRFHPQWTSLLWVVESTKWAVKRCSGRSARRTSRRDILSRGMCAEFDCADAKRDLGWMPVSSYAAFHRRAILPHVR